jgi:hypothetical protein
MNDGEATTLNVGVWPRATPVKAVSRAVVPKAFTVRSICLILIFNFPFLVKMLSTLNRIAQSTRKWRQNQTRYKRHSHA